jgi:hypothetical protein
MESQSIFIQFFFSGNVNQTVGIRAIIEAMQGVKKYDFQEKNYFFVTLVIMILGLNDTILPTKDLMEY